MVLELKSGLIGEAPKAEHYVPRPISKIEVRQKWLQSLKFDQINARHDNIRTALPKTCQWLLQKAQYRSWLDFDNLTEHHGFLWIKGKPATGKSTIMKFACANVRKNFTDRTLISFFFNARGEVLEKSVLGMYQSLLFQLLQKLPHLQDLFDTLDSNASSRKASYEWNISRVRTLFFSAIRRLGQSRITCFIDALDECNEDEIREMIGFFEEIGQFAIASQIYFQVCFSSRHYPHITIRHGLNMILEGQEEHEQDIAKYLHDKLRAGDNKVITQIKVEILQRASGIFLWVVLVVDMLNKAYDHGRIHALRARLNEIPDGLDELFQDILTRDCQNIEELIFCFQWILYSKRPLKPEELYFAVLAGIESDEIVGWDTSAITSQLMEWFILSSSKGLAELTKERQVQFIHESVRDLSS